MSIAALPALRNELRLLPAAADHDGSPAWLVQDPVANRFYRIGWLDFELLLRWGNGGAQQVLDAVNAETTLTAQPEDLLGLIQFLQTHSLLRVSTKSGVDQLVTQARNKRKNGYEWWIENYLFIRVPLLRPQLLLRALHARIKWLFSTTSAWVLLAIAALGIFLASRQWDIFAATFVDSLTWAGLVGFSLALVFSKALHELGHALTATHYGVRVGHMGVALVVLFPMLYTDTSESWKLKNPRQRLAIASAGIVAELALAGLATLAWSLAPEGSVKSALFFLATTSWILTLGINASPFMRFDGYFILMDWLDFPNLHERSTALARVWLRRRLLGLNDDWPEQLPARGNAWLIGFALLTWVYRLIVFIGIALLVYYFFFKILGIVLFIVELAVFVVRPIWSELKVWWTRRGELSGPRRVLWAGGLMALGALLLLPWQSEVRGAGWLHAAKQQQIFAPFAARLLSFSKEGEVRAGQTLFVLESPDAAISAQRAHGLAEAREKELVGLAELPGGEERRASVALEREKFLAEADLYAREQSRLNVVAPFGGLLLDLDALLAPGVWVQPRQHLGVLIDPSEWLVDVFVAESDITRIRAGAPARVQVESFSPYFLTGRVKEIDVSRTATLPDPMLEAKFGGPIVTLDTEGSASAPRDALYRVRIALTHPSASARVMICKASIEAEGRSLLTSFLERVGATLIRESGF